jgi:hypothetical protein
MDVVLTVASNAGGLQRNLRCGFHRVAGMAFETPMRSIQDVPGLFIVIEAPADPTIWIVTQRAIARKATFMMPVPMAVHAGARCILERRRAMTFLAWHDGMAPDQRESRDIVIECDLSPPAGFFVALLAATAELGLVRIVLLVTRDAVGREFVTIKIAGVTGVAFDLRVFAPQRKLGHFIVVELYGFPLGRSVASFTLGAVTGGMSVLQAMTGYAGHRQVLVALAGVTSAAGDIFVGALKRELRLAVIVCLDATPAVLAVAAIAFFAKALSVWILRLVTIEATPRRAAKDNCGLMAAVASCRLVPPLEFEVRKRVVEGLPVELDNVGTASFVVRVAEFALLVQRINLAAVKAVPVPAIRRDILVTCGAEAGL